MSLQNPFTLESLRSNLKFWMKNEKDAPKIFNIINNIHDAISSYDYPISEYTSPIFCYDVVTIIDTFDWKTLDTTIESLLKYNTMPYKTQTGISNNYIFSRKEKFSKCLSEILLFNYSSNTTI